MHRRADLPESDAGGHRQNDFADHGTRDVGRALEQIWAAYVTHEHEVAGENSHRFRGGGPVRDEKGEVLGGVPGRVHHADRDAADAELGPVAEQLRARGGGVTVAPILAALVRQEQPRARPVGQLPRAGHEIGVDVGLGDVGDAEPLGLRAAQIRLEMAVGIYDQRLARGLAADEIAGLRELVVVEASEEHACLASVSSMMMMGGLPTASSQVKTRPSSSRVFIAVK